MFYQLLPTKQYAIQRSNEQFQDTTCRICNTFPQESVKHLVSNCSVFANSLYKARHDNALKCFVWELLHKNEIIEKQPTWYDQDKVKPYYEKGSFKFWWDCPEYSGRDNEVENPLKPDGKLLIEVQGVKKVFLIEMTVPWPGNREEKYQYKCEKYKNIQQNLKLEYPEYEVGQITLVMDVYGGFSKDLADNIGKVISGKDDIKSIIKNMQKSIISSLAHLSRTFKIRCK